MPTKCLLDYKRKWRLVNEYFITVELFLDSFNTYSSVEPLDSRLHLHLYMYDKRMKLHYQFHLFEELFLGFLYLLWQHDLFHNHILDH